MGSDQRRQSVAAITKWTEWTDSPAAKPHKAIRDYKWGAPSQSKRQSAEVNAALQGARNNHIRDVRAALRPAPPIGPFLAVADVRSDGSVIV